MSTLSPRGVMAPSPDYSLFVVCRNRLGRMVLSQPHFHFVLSIFTAPKLAQKSLACVQRLEETRPAPFDLAFALPICSCFDVPLDGTVLWLVLYGYPFVAFAFVYSAQLYVYHYRTTLGHQTLFHARRLTGSKLISWWLLNLNEHDTHHQRPKVVWHRASRSRPSVTERLCTQSKCQYLYQGLFQQ